MEEYPAATSGRLPGAFAYRLEDSDPQDTTPVWNRDGEQQGREKAEAGSGEEGLLALMAGLQEAGVVAG